MVPLTDPGFSLGGREIEFGPSAPKVSEDLLQNMTDLTYMTTVACGHRPPQYQYHHIMYFGSHP